MLVEVEHLSLGYERQAVIHDISFQVEEKDFIIVLGSNGVGKSTLIKGMLGLIKPIEGKITYHTDNIGYMPQETRVDPNFPASVLEVIMSGFINKVGIRPFYNKNEKKKALEIMEILKITDLKKKIFSELSGGQRQKVLLARSLCATENLLILDEPSNNLDQKSKSEFYTTLKHLNEGHNITIIMITHDIDSDSLIGNKVLALSQGGYYFGKTDDYLEANL